MKNETAHQDHLDIKDAYKFLARNHARDAVSDGTPDDDVGVAICDIRHNIGRQLARITGRDEGLIRSLISKHRNNPEIITATVRAGPASQLATCPAFKDAEEIQKALRTQTKAGTAVVVIASEGVYSWYAADFK